LAGGDFCQGAMAGAYGAAFGIVANKIANKGYEVASEQTAKAESDLSVSNDPTLSDAHIAGMKEAYSQSKPGAVDSREHGGFLMSDPNEPVKRLPPGTIDRMTFPYPPKSAIGFYHTHPFGPVQNQPGFVFKDQGPSCGDRTTQSRFQIPGYICNRNGILRYNSNPAEDVYVYRW